MERNGMYMIIGKSGRNVGVREGDDVYVYSPETVGGLKVTKIPYAALLKHPLHMFPGFDPYVVDQSKICQLGMMDATGECGGMFARVPEKIMEKLKAAHVAAVKNRLVS